MIKLKAPATSANLGAGYDIFGLALNKPTDHMKFERAKETKIELKGKYGEKIPEEVRENSAGVVINEMTDKGVRVVIEKNIPPGSGLGSSAASAAGAAVGINKLFDLGFSRREMLEFAALGEEAAAGEKHYDNVAPCLFGDFCLVDDEVVSIEVPDFRFVVVYPNSSNLTSEARKLVPKEVEIDELKENVGFASKLLLGLYEEDLELFGQGLNDSVVVPARSKKIEGFEEARDAALGAGAFGCTLSGSGPSMIAVGRNEEKIGMAMQDALKELGISSEVYVAEPSKGVTILE
ncbi:homoserine kinase [archaeon SCG-AAA382B04]|nr:homoserine kinase [archaeon SCG-AAA382B04]